MRMKKPRGMHPHVDHGEHALHEHHIRTAQAHLNPAEGLQPQPLNGGDELRRDMRGGVGTGMEPRFGGLSGPRTGARTRSYTG